jgi:hypothetical protein
MRKLLSSAALLLALAAPAAPAAAQTAAPAPHAEREAVLAVVNRLFDAMRQGDTAMLRSTFHPDARMATAAVRNGTPMLNLEGVDGFATALGGKPAEQVWDERLYNEVVHIDGTLATVWTEYDFYLGDQFSHCGVDSFQLAKTADGWRIFSIADTRQREGCPKREGGAAGHDAHGAH